MKFYIENIIPELCPRGDDSNYGSLVTKDVSCLQVLSQRIHYGFDILYFILFFFLELLIYY